MPRRDSAKAGDLLLWFIRQGFTRHVVGPPGEPRAVVLFRVWERHGYVDVIHIRGPLRTEVARVLRATRHDVYRPRFVVWHYWGEVVDSLEALRNLPEPASPDAPTLPYQPPRELAGADDPGFGTPLWITPEDAKFVRIKLPPSQPE